MLQRRSRPVARSSRLVAVALIAATASCGSDSPSAPALESLPALKCSAVPNYAMNTDLGGRLERWEAFPLTVAIDSSSMALVESWTVWRMGIELGLRAWADATNGALGTTRLVSDASTADIVVRVSTVDPDSDCSSLDCRGEVTTQVYGGRMHRAVLLLYPEARTTWTRDKVAQVTAHEMGHALGILLHSFDPADLMWGGGLGPPVIERYPWITPADLNTLAYAYCDP